MHANNHFGNLNWCYTTFPVPLFMLAIFTDTNAVTNAGDWTFFQEFSTQGKKIFILFVAIILMSNTNIAQTPFCAGT